MAISNSEHQEKAQLDKHVSFERGYPCRIIAIDGTWAYTALLEEISEGGAKLTLNSSQNNLDVSEFFLVLTKWGSVHRRCARLWLNGQQLGVQFIRKKTARIRTRGQQRRHAMA